MQTCLKKIATFTTVTPHHAIWRYSVLHGHTKLLELQERKQGSLGKIIGSIASAGGSEYSKRPLHFNVLSIQTY